MKETPSPQNFLGLSYFLRSDNLLFRLYNSPMSVLGPSSSSTRQSNRTLRRRPCWLLLYHSDSLQRNVLPCEPQEVETGKGNQATGEKGVRRKERKMGKTEISSHCRPGTSDSFVKFSEYSTTNLSATVLPETRCATG